MIQKAKLFSTGHAELARPERSRRVSASQKKIPNQVRDDKHSSKTLGIIGANSMLGSRFCIQAEGEFDLVKSNQNDQIAVDITDRESVDDFFKNHSFDWAILFSGYTDVDGAENQRNDKKGSCWQINVEGVKNVADAAKVSGRGLIFISTAFIFDGKDGPYDENTTTCGDLEKISWYGISKIEAEKYLQSTLQNQITLRIDYPYLAKAENKEDLAKRIWRMYKENKLYPMFNDQFFNPTFADDIYSSLSLLLKKNELGIFHVASPELTTHFDFATELIKVFGGDPRVVKSTSIIDFLKKPGRTPRPVKGGLNVDKITRFGFTPTGWREGIRKIYEQSEGKLL